MIAVVCMGPRLAPLAHPRIDAFLLGFVTACSFAAALFFLRFWKSTRDLLFLAFSLFFLVQGISNVLLLDIPHPNEGSFWNSLIRFLALMGLLGAIVRKNLFEE